jgi:rhodanese-related sulfurtransferase
MVSAAVLIAALAVLGPLTCAADEAVGEALSALLEETKAQTEPITVDEFSAALDTGSEIAIIDIRTEAEFDAGHIRGAQWHPRGKLEFHAAQGKLASVDAMIVVYCKRNGRASLAARTLADLGYTNVKYLEGGFEAWVTAGQPIFNMHGELTVMAFEKSETASE